MMFCPDCGHEVTEPTALVCSNCGTEIQWELLVQEERNDGGGEVGALAITNFIPDREEKIVKCNKCGGENHRGEVNCIHCGNLILPLSEHDEIVDSDNEIIRKIGPKYQDEYLKVAAQLYILRRIGKIGTYPCSTLIENPDRTVGACSYPLDFSMPKCPNCNQKNEIYYNCKNKRNKNPDKRCDQKITLTMLSCPKCHAPTMLSDMIQILDNKRRGNNSLDLVEKFLQPDFHQFPLLKKTLSITLSHSRLVDMKFDLEATCERLSKILNYLADFLEIVTKRQGSFGMASIYQKFNPFTALNSSGSAPIPADDLTRLLDDRESQINQEGTAPSNIQNDDDDDDDDDMFDFSL